MRNGYSWKDKGKDRSEGSSRPKRMIRPWREVAFLVGDKRKAGRMKRPNN